MTTALFNITQRLDHFNDSNSATFIQYYQYNSKFFDKTRPLAFLMIGAEGPIGAAYGGDKWTKNENVSMMQWAKEFGAAAFQVEHRFYGDTRPFPTQSTENLAYLTPQQVVEDLHNFIGQMNQLYFSGLDPMWIAFGGSYGGSLSAWFRVSHPEDTIGAVSTSSAVNVVVDYYGYAINAENNYRRVSSACAHAIATGFAAISQAMFGSNETRNNLVQSLGLCQNFSSTLSLAISLAKQAQYMFSNIYGIFQDVNQYSGDNRDARSIAGQNISTLCSVITNAKAGIDGIQKVIQWYNKINSQPCVDNDYTGFITNLQKTDYSDLNWASYRTWIWQTCTYLGYFQTTDGGNSGIFGSTIPLDFYVD